MNVQLFYWPRNEIAIIRNSYLKGFKIGHSYFCSLKNADSDELLAEILIRGIREQLKRGIYKEYIAVEEEMPLMKFA